MAKNKLTDDYCKRFLLSCKQEAETAKHDRMELNKDNYDMYQLRHDFSHKRKGQSREVLSKTRNAVEQIKSFFQQALADLDDWWRVTAAHGDGSDMLVTPEEIQKLTNYMLKRADYFSHVGQSVQSGLLGALSVSKVRGCMKPKPKFKVRGEGKGKSYRKNVVAIDDKTWELVFDVIRQEDYYPDPTGADLFRIEESEVDLSLVRQLSEGDDAIYDREAVLALKGYTRDAEQDNLRARESGQNTATPSMRPRVKLTEFWGTVVDSETGDILCENCVITLANDEHIIRRPTPNPLWHQRTPIIHACLIEVANSVWGIALMDAGTKHNRSLIEIFNLMLDSAMKAVWGVSQIRVDALNKPEQLTDGIRWGTNLEVNASLPPGAKVMEEVITGDIPQDTITMYNLLTQETVTSMMTSDLRMGAVSQRAVKATEVVAAENSMTSVFQGIAKNFEERMIQPELELSVMTIAQNWDLIDPEIFKSLFGADRGEQLSAMEPQEVFVNIVNNAKFEVFGISLTLRRQADFRKYTTLLQVIGASEVLVESFLAKYSFEKLMGEIMDALDVDKSKIRTDDVQQDVMQGQGQGPAQSAQQQPGAAGAPDQMSQVPQAGGTPQGGLASAFLGNQMNAPSSQAMG